jgi:polar amino acid transport system substrate-binding protein
MNFRTDRLIYRICPVFLCGFLLSLTLSGVFNPSGLVAQPDFEVRGKLRIAIKDNLPPLGFRDRLGNLVGFEIDLAREIAKELLGDSNAVEFVPVKNDERFPALLENRVDIAIAQISLTPNRARLVDFSLPYYQERTVLIAKIRTSNQGSEFNLGSEPRINSGIDAASNSGIKMQIKKVAALKNSTTIAAIQSAYPKAEIIGAISYNQAIQALELEQVQAIAGDYLALSAWLQTNPEYGIVGQPLDFNSLAIAIPKGLQHKTLFLRTIQALDKLRQNNWLKQKAIEWHMPI